MVCMYSIFINGTFTFSIIFIIIKSLVIGDFNNIINLNYVVLHPAWQTRAQREARFHTASVVG